MFYLAWEVQTFYSFGIFDKIMQYFKREHGIAYVEFLDKFTNILEEHDGNISKEIKIVKKYIEDGYNGKGWEHVDKNLGDIYWSIEEASWLRIVKNLDSVEILKCLTKFCECANVIVEDEKLCDLIDFQIFLITKEKDHTIHAFNYYWKEYFNEESCGYIDRGICSYEKPLKIGGDVENWNYECIWYGRTRGRYKTLLEELT
jgi:hypothetical protein